MKKIALVIDGSKIETDCPPDLVRGLKARQMQRKLSAKASLTIFMACKPKSGRG